MNDDWRLQSFLWKELADVNEDVMDVIPDGRIIHGKGTTVHFYMREKRAIKFISMRGTVEAIFQVVLFILLSHAEYVQWLTPCQLKANKSNQQ